MNRHRIVLAAGATVAAAMAVAALYPQFNSRATSHKRATPEQKAWILRQQPLLEQGKRALAHGDHAAAETAFLAAIQEEPDDHSLSMNLAQVYDAQGRDRDALGAYARVVEPYEKGSSSYQTDPRVLARYGDLLAKFGEPTKAAAVYRTAAQAGERNPPSNASYSTLRGVAHVAAGEKFLGENDAKGAEREFSLSLASVPNAWEAKYYLGIAKAQLGDSVGAKAALDAAERIAPASELKRLRRRRAGYGIGTNSTIAVIKITGKTATLSEEPAVPGP